MASTDPTGSITLRNRWGREYTKRWKRVIAEIKRDVNANVNALVERFVIGNNGDWMLPFIRETVAKSESLSSRDLGEVVALAPSERNTLIDEIHTEALNDLRNIRDEVATQASSKSTQVLIDTPDERRDISKVVGVVGAIGFLRPDTVPAQTQAIIDRINKIAITRSITSVAVRVIGGISMGITAVAKSIGAVTVGVEAEKFTTAGDDDVCILCETLETTDRFGLGEGVFPVDATGGIIPVHPRCRCRWVLVRVRQPIFNEQELTIESLEPLLIANGWQKQTKTPIITIPEFRINKGEQGKQGTQGERGKVGLRGMKGKSGAIRIIKEPAINGRNGLDGIQGLIGNEGERGATGATGDDGKQGEQGDDGSDGRGIRSIKFNQVTNELVIKFTDGTEQRIKWPMSTKRPLLGARGTGGGDRVANLPYENTIDMVITEMPKFPIVTVYDDDGDEISHIGVYFPSIQMYGIVLPETTSGVVAVIPIGKLVTGTDPLLPILQRVTVNGEDRIDVAGDLRTTVLGVTS
jgi:hypothetical protein